MSKTLLTTIAMFLFSALHTVTAQDRSNAVAPSAAAPVITATASAERARFTAPSTTVQMHLQVYTDAGQPLFDSSSKGNVLEWNLLGGSGERVPDGPYLCVVTVKSLSGRLSQRIGSVSLQQQLVQLQPVEATQFTPAQQQAVGPIEENGALTILKAGETKATTVLANDGRDGQLIRSQGALSFRLGDFFSGTDQEQMRLTANGRLGIGTSDPQSTLDVAGTVRATKGIEFADGTVQTTGLSGRKDKDGNIVPNVAGTGTQNRIAKWTDNAGTLGDSTLFEAAGGNLGIGTTTPNVNAVVHADKAQNTASAVFVTNNSPGTGALASIRAGLDPANSTVNYASLNILGANWPAGLGGSFLKGRTGLIESSGSNFGIGNINNTEPLLFYTTAARTERMRLTADGKLGIGTTAPGFRLEINDASNNGLRVATQSTGGTVASFGSTGNFNIDAPFIPGGRFTVLENGNIGIGVPPLPLAPPLARLDIAGGRDGNGDGSGAHPIAFSFGNGGGFRHWIRTRHHAQAIPGNAIDFFTNTSNLSNGSSAPGVGNQLVLTLDGGNVGIGTPNPSSRLHIFAPSSPNPISAMTIDVQSFQTPGNAVASNFFRVLDVFSGGPSAFLIRGDGNIGVGTDAPNAKLQVANGDVYVATEGNGLILKSPNGAVCRRLAVDNFGFLSLVAVTCP